MSDDVILAKAQIVERCIQRAREEMAASADFATDFTRQDAALLNIQRACDAALDIAYRLVRLKGLGAPANSREALDLLGAEGVIDADQVAALKQMVGFRNVAVHRYTDLDLALVRQVIDLGLDDLVVFVAVALRL